MAEKKNKGKEGSSKDQDFGEDQKASLIDISVEDLDAAIIGAEHRLQSINLQEEIWLKQPLFHDPSYHLCFSKLEDPDGVIMVQQIAGQSLRLLNAPRYLKQSGAMVLERLIELAQTPPVQEQEGETD